jgi:hypothetical protein
MGCKPGHLSQYSSELVGHGGAAESSGSGPHHGDANLHRGQKPFRLFSHGQHGASGFAPVVYQLLESCLPDRQDCDFSSRKETVGESQGEDDEKLGQIRLRCEARASLT